MLTNVKSTASLLIYLFGSIFRLNLYVGIAISTQLSHRSALPASSVRKLTVSSASVLIFILTILLLAADFYYLKNIAGRRLVGLRWWNEVNTSTGESTWVFESADGRGDNNGNKTDSRFFWLALYAQPAWWILLAFWAVVTMKFVWLSVVGMYSLWFPSLVMEIWQ